MCRCCTHLRVSDYLNVEMTNDQACILDPTLEDVTLREILKDAGGSGATKKLAKRKMDAAGFVNAHCCEVTGEKRQRELNSALELAASLAEIHRAEHEEATSKKQIAEAGFQETAPLAIQKLRCKGGDLEKLTIGELQAIAAVHFMNPIEKGKKAQVLSQFEALKGKYPSVLPNLLSPKAVAAPPIANTAPTPAPVATIDWDAGPSTVAPYPSHAMSLLNNAGIDPTSAQAFDFLASL